MIEQVDSGFSPENLAEAEALWANLPVGNRSWTGLATHEKALVCHTVQRLRIAAEARGMAEIERLQSDVTRQMDIANEQLQEVERLREALDGDLVEASEYLDLAAHIGGCDVWKGHDCDCGLDRLKHVVSTISDSNMWDRGRAALNGGQPLPQPPEKA